MQAMEPLAARLDAVWGGQAHRQAVLNARALLDAPERLPSARVLDVMASDYGNSFLAFGLGRYFRRS